MIIISARLSCFLFLKKIRHLPHDASVQAEVNQAKETVDLLRMAHAITRLDALDAEIEAVKKAQSVKSAKTNR